MIALAQFDASARQVRLEIEVAPALPTVMGDPGQLQQVLLNLVFNAMDAVADLPADRRKVTVRAQRHGEREVEVAVGDSGPGIALERLGRLFEPFFTTKPNGMGIGWRRDGSTNARRPSLKGSSRAAAQWLRTCAGSGRRRQAKTLSAQHVRATRQSALTRSWFGSDDS